MNKKEKEFLKSWYCGLYLTTLRLRKKSKTDKSKDLRIRKLRAETAAKEAEYVLMNLMDDGVTPTIRKKAEEIVNTY